MPSLTVNLTIRLPFKTAQDEFNPLEPIRLHTDEGDSIVIHAPLYDYPRTLLTVETMIVGTRSLEIELTTQVDGSIHGTLSDANDDKIANIINTFLNKFILHCRIETRQYWWYPIFYKGYNLSDIRFHMKIVNNDNGEVISDHPITTGGLPPLGCGINLTRWKKIKNKLEAGVEPSIVDFYMEEARSAIFFKNVELMVVNTAIAIEVFSSRFWVHYAQKNGQDLNPNYLILAKDNRISRVQKNFRKYPNLLTGTDLFSADRNLFDSISYLFQTRNKIVHEGNAYYSNGTSRVQVTYPEAHQFFSDAQQAARWLQSIDKNIAEDLLSFDQ